MIPLAVPNLTGNEKKYLDHCIETTFVSSVGEYVNQFETAVAEETGCDHAVATSSGTTGLHAALTAVGVKHGELVIIPSFTFIATANAVAHCGAMPWIMDISLSDWCLDPDVVEREIINNCIVKGDDLIHVSTGKRVAALMPVYTLGNIPQMDHFREIADKYNVPLVADAACAIGATYKGHKFGDLADLSVLSFNGNKTITCGGGGAVAGNDEKLLSLVRHLTTTARVGREYDFDMVGFNYRMTNVNAAIGCAQMERLNEFIEKKRFIRQFYNDELKNMDVECFAMTEGSSCWFSGFVLKEPDGIDRVRIIVEKLKEAGIEGRTFWKPIHLQQIYKDCIRSSVVNSDSIWGRIITLPCSTGISEEELKETLDAVKRIQL